MATVKLEDVVLTVGGVRIKGMAAGDFVTFETTPISDEAWDAMAEATAPRGMRYVREVAPKASTAHPPGDVADRQE